MPKATKLHGKGKSNKSIQKPCNNSKDSPDTADTSITQYQLELCWCIQQLERFLEEKKGNEKQMQDAWKVLMVLKNNDQPHIRKRQLMRTHFGDYRAKMAAEEEKKLAKTSKLRAMENTNETIQKSCRKFTSCLDSTVTSMAQYQVQVLWCIQKLEYLIEEKKGDEQRMEDMLIALMVLKNKDEPCIRKHQIMEAHFGDYKTMLAAEEERRLAKLPSKMKIVKRLPTEGKGIFLRKYKDSSASDNENFFSEIPFETMISKHLESLNDVAPDSVSPEKFKMTISKSEFKFNFNALNEYFS